MAPPVCIASATHAGPGLPLRVSHRRVAAGKQGHCATDAALDTTHGAQQLPVTVKVTWAPSTESPQRSAHDGGEDSVPLPAVGTPPHPGASPAGALKRNHVTDRIASAQRCEEVAPHGVDVAMAAAPPGCGTPEAKRPRASAISAAAASDNAIALGYELGTIKHSAFVLLHAAGPAGLTVSIIVETASKAGMYCWGTCKTPNNSVTAALSQDPNFQRVAPSTYALRDVLKPVGQAALREAQAAKAAAAALENAARKDQAVAGGGAALPPLAPASKPKTAHKAARPRPKVTASGSRSSDGGAQQQHAGKHSAHGENHHAVARVLSAAAGQQGHMHTAASQRRGADAADHVMPALGVASRCVAEEDAFAVMPATSSASLYPPPSPEEAPAAGGGSPADECTSPDAAQVKRSAPRRGGQSSGRGGRLQARYAASEPDAAPAAAAPSEAQARADRWRAEAAALWHSSVSRSAKVDEAGCSDPLPQWVVIAFLADKARRASGDSCSDDAYATPTPPQVSPMALRAAA
jgi:hypothetical protein